MHLHFNLFTLKSPNQFSQSHKTQAIDISVYTRKGLIHKRRDERRNKSHIMLLSFCLPGLIKMLFCIDIFHPFCLLGTLFMRYLNSFICTPKMQLFAVVIPKAWYSCYGLLKEYCDQRQLCVVSLEIVEDHV